MAGARPNGSGELEPWKKALLSRDFDLVHTQLLLLDGDVTPSERARLVQEIFTVVKQIEELTSGFAVKTENDGASCEEAITPTSPERQNLESLAVKCPVCEISFSTGLPREDWFCNSCRLFKKRLETWYVEGRQLPTCNHKGKNLFDRCRGCRRFNLEVFWLKKREHQTPFELPLMSDDCGPNERRSSPSEAHDSPNGKDSDSEAAYDSDLDWQPN